MRNLFLLFLLGASVFAHAQTGYEVIDKAEKLYERGRYTKALVLLKRAENMNYGFCGNAWMSAHRSIGLLRSSIYIEQGKYQRARNTLDSLLSLYPDDNGDSIRIVSYQLEYGKDTLSKYIDEGLENVRFHDVDFLLFVEIPLSNGIIIRLKPQILEVSRLYTKNRNEQIPYWREEFKKSSNYKLIKGG